MLRLLCCYTREGSYPGTVSKPSEKLVASSLVVAAALLVSCVAYIDCRQSPNPTRRPRFTVSNRRPWQARSPRETRTTRIQQPPQQVGHYFRPPLNLRHPSEVLSVPLITSAGTIVTTSLPAAVILPFSGPGLLQLPNRHRNSACSLHSKPQRSLNCCTAQQLGCASVAIECGDFGPTNSSRNGCTWQKSACPCVHRSYQH